MIDFLNEAGEIKDQLVSFRRHLHQIPEVGMDLPETTKYVMDELQNMGCNPVEIAPSCISATIGKENPTHTILLRTDMDALPMPEKSGLDFASPYENRSHTCGHDIHMAIMLGVAKVLKKHEDKLSGCVKLMFQPGEEIWGGAKKMIDAKILEEPKVHAALDMHVHPVTTVGNLHFTKGSFTSSGDNFEINIQGKGGHGSSPHLAIDPIIVASHIILAIQALISREAPPQEHVVLSICSVNSGSSYNIISDTATIKGTLRTYNPDLRNTFLDRISSIAKLTAEAFRASADFQIESGTPPVVNDPNMVDQVTKYLGEMDFEYKSIPNLRLPASDDFGYIAEKVPSVMFSIGAKPEGVKDNFVHNPKVVFDEDVLPLGTAIFAHCAYRWLEEAAINIGKDDNDVSK